MSPIIKVYANLIIHHLKTIDQIPFKYRLAVEEYVKQLTSE